MLHVTSLITILLIIYFINIQTIFCTFVNPTIEVLAKIYQNDDISQEYFFITMTLVAITITLLLPRIILISLLLVDILMFVGATIGTLIMIIFGIISCQYMAIKKKIFQK
uniref:DUF1189 domain-containing protein n=1 Tax=Strongyloides papillosus TaxID=174720 RepID=A0A0N5BV06_STREA